jgi:DHA1 family tetracycline resistance protein-like MFS transporter
VAFSLFAFAATPGMLYAVLAVSAVLWSVGPALQSLISREVPPERQGELQGAVMSLISLTSIVNPLVMTLLFSVTSDRSGGFYFPGSPYLLAGVLLLGGWALAWRWDRTHAAPAPATA